MQVSLTYKSRVCSANTSCRKGLAPRPYVCFSGAWRHEYRQSKTTRWAVHTSLLVQIGGRQFPMPLTRRLVPSRFGLKRCRVLRPWRALMGVPRRDSPQGMCGTPLVVGRSYCFLSRLALCLIVQVESAGKSTVCRHSAEAPRSNSNRPQPHARNSSAPTAAKP